MKKSLRTSKQKREYTTEFKIYALKLVEDQGYTVKGTSERLGIPISYLTRWLSQYRKGELQSCYARAQSTAAEAELKRLRAENKRLEQEVAILKKASAYSSHEPAGRQASALR